MSDVFLPRMALLATHVHVLWATQEPLVRLTSMIVLLIHARMVELVWSVGGNMHMSLPVQSGNFCMCFHRMESTSTPVTVVTASMDFDVRLRQMNVPQAPAYMELLVLLVGI